MQPECVELGLAGGAYALCEQALDHASAIRDCALRGGHLLSIESAEEDAAASEAIFALLSNNVWLGGTRTADFVWSWPSGMVFWNGGRDGEPAPEAFVLWQSGEPNNSSSKTGGEEACLALTAEGGDWNDRSCSLELPYVCEAD